MENENRDFQTSPNKDLWLFLIVLDVVFLGAFGFFLYKHFFAQVLSPAPFENTAVVTEVVETLPPADNLEVVTVEEEVPAMVAQPQEEPVPVEKPVEAVNPAPAVEQPTLREAVPQVTETKPTQPSVVVAAVNGSKYRRVTFRWFEPADTVAIVSGFTNRKPQPLKKVGDYWETTLSIAPGTYKFLYVINGKNRRDPYSPAKDGRSVVVVE